MTSPQAILAAMTVTALLLPSGAKAQGVCHELLHAYETAAKQVSYLFVESTRDDSIRANTVRQLKINNYLLWQQINLTLLIRNGCSAPAKPAWEGAYSYDAAHCLSADNAAGIDRYCDRDTWQR